MREHSFRSPSIFHANQLLEMNLKKKRQHTSVLHGIYLLFISIVLHSLPLFRYVCRLIPLLRCFINNKKIVLFFYCGKVRHSEASNGRGFFYVETIPIAVQSLNSFLV